MKLNDPKVGIKISGLAMVLSGILLMYLYFADQSLWLGFVMILCSITILFSNISALKEKEKKVEE